MQIELERLLRPWDAATRVERKLEGGSRSDVWLAFIGGRKCTARLSKREPPAIDWELRLMEFARTRAVGAPKVVPTASGELHRDRVFVVEWVDGDLPGSERDWRDVAGALERLHGLTRDWKQRPAFASSSDLMYKTRGGDIDLRAMPEDAVEVVRAAWAALADEPLSAIHGDPRGNVLITADGPAFIDWDECRVDASILDLADLPHAEARIDSDRLARARAAANAWEAANSWLLEPEYARRRLAELL